MDWEGVQNENFDTLLRFINLLASHLIKKLWIYPHIV